MAKTDETIDPADSDADDNEPGEDVLHDLGELDALVNDADSEDGCEGVDPENVGRWLTIIGRALLAIFHP